jgi:hypothetical protein
MHDTHCEAEPKQSKKGCLMILNSEIVSSIVLQRTSHIGCISALWILFKSFQQLEPLKPVLKDKWSAIPLEIVLIVGRED